MTISAQSLHGLADSMCECVITLDRDGAIRHANAAMEKLTACPPALLVGQPLSRLLDEPGVAEIVAQLRGGGTGGNPFCGDIREADVKRQDQTRVPVRLSLSQVDTAEDRFYLCILRDITALRRNELAAKRASALLMQIINGSPVPTFVINEKHIVTHWNHACEVITGRPAAKVVGTRAHQGIFYATERPTMADLIVDGASARELNQHYCDKRLTRSQFVSDAYEAEDFFPDFGEDGTWLYFTAGPLRNVSGKVIGAIETLQDVTERHVAEEELVRHMQALEQTVGKRTEELGEAHRQLLQSEKLASIGQLAAGMAHEINNPVGFVHSNIGSLRRYFEKLLQVMEHFESHPELMNGTGDTDSQWVKEARAVMTEADYAYLKEDIPALLAESVDGLERVRKIVQDLRDFSRVDSAQQWELADLRKGLDSTLNIVHNAIKYSADVVREYGDIPPVECLPSQLNQVFMNLVVNAAQAMPDGKRGTITLRCGSEGDSVWVDVADDGSGISPENLQRIFDPFFTTKPVGKGTGLGLSLSFGIVEKHGGKITATSRPGVGTTFRVSLPVRQSGKSAATAPVA
jgi:PAS domain S-box-containing protein